MQDKSLLRVELLGQPCSSAVIDHTHIIPGAKARHGINIDSHRRFHP
jgi:hypothetical protein